MQIFDFAVGYLAPGERYSQWANQTPYNPIEFDRDNAPTGGAITPC